MQRDKIMDVLLAIGIIYVVLGHNYQPQIIPFRAYSFHMGLFFFISGYFFKPRYTLPEKIPWIKHKALKQLIPYFVLNLCFALLTLFLKTYQINLGKEISVYSLGIAPVLHGHQFALFAPAWFVIQLFIVHLVYQSLYWKDTKTTPLLITGLLVAASALLISTTGSGMNEWKRILVRTSFATAFYSIGYLYSVYKANINPLLFQAKTLLLALVGYGILESYCKPLTYELVWARFTNASPLVPFASSLLVIVIMTNLAHGFVAFFPGENLIYCIGRHTFPIMCFHLTIFFGVNLILWQLGVIEYANLSQGNFRWNVSQVWFLYSIPGLLIPAYCSILYHKLKVKCQDRFAPSRTVSL